MSSPLPSQADLVATQRLKTAAGAAGAYPQVASVLAQSDLSQSQIGMVGNFIQGLDTATLNRLATNSGAVVPLTPAQQDQLSALGEVTQNPTPAANPAPPNGGDPRNWLERTVDSVGTALSNTGSFVAKVLHPALWALNQLGTAVHMPIRLLDAAIDPSETAKSMQQEGYDPNSGASWWAFMWNKGDAQFHNLSGVRAQFADPRIVDLAMMQHADPQGFQAFVDGAAQLDPNTGQVIGVNGNLHGQALTAHDLDLIHSDDFQKAAQLVDQQAASPGRDLAHLITLGHTNNQAFHVLSGVLDATYDIAADPTLIGGKVLAGMKMVDAAGNLIRQSSRFEQLTGQGALVRAGIKLGDGITSGAYRAKIESAADTEGMRALITNPNYRVGQQAAGFVNDASTWRSMIEQGDTQGAGQLLASMQVRYKAWMPFFDEVNGRQVMTQAERKSPDVPFDGVLTDVTGESHPITMSKGPITDVHQFADYLASNDGLLRMGNGIAAKREVYLPGRVSLTTRLMAANAARRAGNADDASYVIDHAKPYKQLPNEAEESVQQALDGALSTDAQAGDAIFQRLRTGTNDGYGWNVINLARAKFDKTARRWSTFLPTTNLIDLNAADAAQNVRRVSRMYLDKGHSDQLTSAFLAGNTAQRRQVYNSVVEQMYHASGLSRSEDGRAWYQQYLADQDLVDQRAYALQDPSTGKGLDVVQTPSGERHVAMVPSQISQFVRVPDFQQMSYLASKSAAAGFLRRTRGTFLANTTQSPTADALMGLVKLGWITTPAAGGRNAADELLSVVGEKNVADWAAGRALWGLVSNQSKREARTQGAQGALNWLGARVPGWAKQGVATFHDAIGAHIFAGLARVIGGPQRLDLSDPKTYQYALERRDAYEKGLLSEHVTGVHVGEDVAEPFGNDATVQLHQQGLAAQPFGVDPTKAKHYVSGYEQVETDLGAGMDHWVSQLSQYFRDGEQGLANVMLKAKIDGEDPIAAGVEALNSPALRHFVKDSESLQTVPGTGKRVQTPGEQQAAIIDHARRLDQQIDLMVRGRGRPAVDAGIVDEARAWKSAALRERAAQAAQAAQDNHAGLVDMAEEAKLSAQELTAHHGRLAAAADELSRLQEQLDLARIELTVRTDHLHSVFPPDYLDDLSHDDYMRALAERENAPESHAVNEARIRYDDLRGRVAELEGTAPPLADVEHARTTAWSARQRANYLQRRVETNARKVQANTLNEDHAQSAAHLDDADLRAFYRATGRDPSELGQGDVVDRGINGELAERLIQGDVPDAGWLLHNVAPHERPAHTIRPIWAPVNEATGNAAQNIARGMAQYLNKGFHLVVEKPVQAISRNPMHTTAYVQARMTLEPYEQHLIETGMDKEIAEQTAQRMALSHADALVLKSIDNHTVQTQFELLSRNWWAFSRAQADWLRRWSRIVKENPEVVRKAQLAIHAGTATGMIDQDPTTGQLNFVYPGSGMVINALTKVAQAFGLKGLANIPVMPDLRSNLLYMNPSADNPLGYSSTPIVSIPFHLLSALMGSHYPLLQASADKIVNGQLGAGRAWYQQIMPSYVNRIMSGVFEDPNTNPADAHSQLGSAMHSALLSMDAAGYLKDPMLQLDPATKQQFLDRLQTQTKTHMVMRALLSMFAPASPGIPTEDVANAQGHYVNQADWTAHKAGWASLTDEARDVFGRMPFDQAMLYWAKFHPDDLPFEQGFSPETQVGTRDAVATATLATAKWMEDNPEFMAKYGQAGGLAAYFMPQGVGNGDQFSQLAYNAQVEQGIRKYLTTTDQLNGILVKHAEQLYFGTKKQYDDAIAQATASGDKDALQAAQDEWSQTKDLIYATNPLLAQKFTGFASNGILNTQVIQQLQQMLVDPVAQRAIGPDQLSGVAQMILALRSYNDAQESVKGLSSPEATAYRSATKSQYEDTINGIVKQLPGLSDLANGAFRTPN